MVGRSLSLRRVASLALVATSFACSLQSTGLGGTGAAPGASEDAVDAAVPSAQGDDAAAGRDAAPMFPGFDGGASEDDALLDAKPHNDVIVLDPDASHAGGGDDPCDLDRDGHRATGACGGDDCCDYDGRAFPNAQAYSETASACGSFDFDCDGQESRRFSQEACKLGFFACSGDGFAHDTACGASADYVTCSYAGFSCNQDTAPRIQPCR
jgi:hypothetical protein